VALKQAADVAVATGAAGIDPAVLAEQENRLATSDRLNPTSDPISYGPLSLFT
jgi:hypothetical protein